MKKLIVLIVALSICSVAIAGIQRDRIANRVISGLSNARNASLNCRVTLNAVKSDLQDLNTAYGSELDSADKTRLISIFTDITNIITELNDLITNIDTNFPSIQ